MKDLARLSQLVSSIIEEMIKENPDDSLQLNTNYSLDLKFKFLNKNGQLVAHVEKAKLIKSNFVRKSKSISKLMRKSPRDFVRETINQGNYL